MSCDRVDLAVDFEQPVESFVLLGCGIESEFVAQVHPLSAFVSFNAQVALPQAFGDQVAPCPAGTILQF